MSGIPFYRCNTIKGLHGTRLVTAMELLINLSVMYISLMCKVLLTPYTANIARTSTNQCKFLYVVKLNSVKQLDIMVSAGFEHISTLNSCRDS